MKKLEKKKEHPKEKTVLHPRNKHRERYNFDELVVSFPQLKPFVIINPYGDQSIDFFNPDAVVMLNKALLKHFYKIDKWNMPEGYLCPSVPGRADYIHYIADLLAEKNSGKIPSGNSINGFDVGVGASCIYPLIANREYGWSFVGSDNKPEAIKSAKEILENNVEIKSNVELRFQSNSSNIFKGIVNESEQFDFTICNPPFYSSFEEARSGNIRKVSNLRGKPVKEVARNFGGNSMELWCDGGEEKFAKRIIEQSKQIADSCFWFTTLISKQAHLEKIYKALYNAQAVEVKTIAMTQGNKSSRIVAWTFLTSVQQTKWAITRWNPKIEVK
ncbi:MAG: 23S rRNA (adenine(1618)-N(6))-methyltransferase RlmF [Bacteroidota bacterium]